VPKQPRHVFDPLGSNHDRAAFSCAQDELTTYLRKYALQHARRHIAATTVLVAAGSTTVIGYHTLSATRLNLGDLPADVGRKFPNFAEGVPATLIGRLAVDSRFDGKGHGRAILMNALEKAHQTTTAVASAFVLVRAIDDRAAAFYSRYGFVSLPDQPHRLFLPMKTIAGLMSG
jgi:predicted GNAT family N-acyltransferase